MICEMFSTTQLTCFPRTFFKITSCFSSKETDVVNLTMVSGNTTLQLAWAGPQLLVMVAMMLTRTWLLSTALAVARLVSDNTVLHRDLSDSEVIFCLSPSSDMASDVLQNPLTTELNCSIRLYFCRACNNKGIKTCNIAK